MILASDCTETMVRLVVFRFNQAGVVTVKSVPNEEGRVVGINGPGGPTVCVFVCTGSPFSFLHTTIQIGFASIVRYAWFGARHEVVWSYGSRGGRGRDRTVLPAALVSLRTGKDCRSHHKNEAA
jgi:hypothetical protein